jgi:CSLREA domain-containing protein
MKIILKSILVVGLLVQSIAFAEVFNVNDTADTDDVNAGDGICATIMGLCTLRAAITEANSLEGVDTINIPSGTYTTASSLSIYSAIIIIGENTGTTIVDANDSARVFFISTNQPVSMSGFTVQGGNAGTSGLGGGIYINSNGDVTLSAMNVNNNKANSGCGIGAGSPINQLTITDSVIENNLGITGGSGPSTSIGGGLRLSQGTVTITDSTIRGNTADSGGGLVYISVDLTIRNTTISDNIATVNTSSNGVEIGGVGGGINAGGGSITKITNSTISNNKAMNNGGGIYMANGYSSVSLFNTTVTNNTADFDDDGNGQGGGIIGGSTSSGGLNFELSNSIVAGNNSNTGVGPDCDSSQLGIISHGYNLIGDNTNCNFSAELGDKIGDSITPIDTMTGPLANNGGSTFTHALLDGSPAIDAGNPASCTDNTGATITTDQRGNMRPSDGGTGMAICDIGAYERSVPPVADAGNDQVVNFSESVELIGTGSIAAVGIASFSWMQLPSNTVTLINATTDVASFSAPSESIVLTFELTIIDNDGLSDSDTVTVTVNAPPVANAGVDQTVNTGDMVNLNGSGSSDADGSIQSYIWTQESGDAVTLNAANSANPDFVAPATGGTLSFQLTVTDNNGAVSNDIVTVTVNQAPGQAPGNTQPNNNGNGGGGSFNIIFLMMLAGISIFRRQFEKYN